MGAKTMTMVEANQIAQERLTAEQADNQRLRSVITALEAEVDRLKRGEREAVFNAIQKNERPMIEENKRLQRELEVYKDLTRRYLDARYEDMNEIYRLQTALDESVHNHSVFTNREREKKMDVDLTTREEMLWNRIRRLEDAIEVFLDTDPYYSCTTEALDILEEALEEWKP